MQLLRTRFRLYLAILRTPSYSRRRRAARRPGAGDILGLLRSSLPLLVPPDPREQGGVAVLGKPQGRWTPIAAEQGLLQVGNLNYSYLANLCLKFTSCLQVHQGTTPLRSLLSSLR
jgi:hypothetical protein